MTTNQLEPMFILTVNVFCLGTHGVIQVLECYSVKPKFTNGDYVFVTNVRLLTDVLIISQSTDENSMSESVPYSISLLMLQHPEHERREPGVLRDDYCRSTNLTLLCVPYGR